MNWSSSTINILCGSVCVLFSPLINLQIKGNILKMMNTNNIFETIYVWVVDDMKRESTAWARVCHPCCWSSNEWCVGVPAGKISNVCILGDRISHTQWQNSFAIGRQLIEGNIPFWVRESNGKLKLILQVSSPPPFDLLATPPPIRKTSLLESFRPRSK